MPRIEDTERGLPDEEGAGAPTTYGNRGDIDELQDMDGDIADEGLGHRG